MCGRVSCSLLLKHFSSSHCVSAEHSCVDSASLDGPDCRCILKLAWRSGVSSWRYNRTLALLRSDAMLVFHERMKCIHLLWPASGKAKLLVAVLVVTVFTQYSLVLK